MNKDYVLKDNNRDGLIYRRIYLLIRQDGWNGQSIGAAFGLAGGMLSIILGGLLWAAAPLLAPGGFASVLNVLEIIFFALPLPLLAVGACCLDLLEKKVPLLSLQAATRPARFDSLKRFRLSPPHEN